MVRKEDLTQQRLVVGTSAVTVTTSITANAIRGIYRLKATNLYAGKNKLYIDGLKGSTATQVDMLRFSVPDEVQDYPGENITEDSLPLWIFDESDYDHIQFTAENATVEVLVLFADASTLYSKR